MKKCKKNLSVLLLACSFVACSATALACQDFTKASANAESMKVTELTTYAMKDGASVKISEDGENGLRFTAKMSTEEYNKIMAYGYESLHFGVAVAPASYHAENPLNWDTMFSKDNAVYDWAVNGEYTDVGKTRIINQASTEMVAEKDANGDLTGNMIMSASVTDVRDGTVTANNPNGVNNIAKKFVGVGYIRYIDPELGVKFLFTNEKDASGTDSVMSNTRSIAQVAERAVAGTAFDDTTKETIAQDYLSVDNLFAQFEQGSTYIWNYNSDRADFKTGAEVVTSATATENDQNKAQADLTKTGKILHVASTMDRPVVQLLPVYSKDYYSALLTAYPDAKISFDVMVKTTDFASDVSVHLLGVASRHWQFQNEWNALSISLSDYVANYDTMLNLANGNNDDYVYRGFINIERHKNDDYGKQVDVYLTEPKLVVESDSETLLNIDESQLFNSTATMQGGNYKYVLTDKDTGASQELLNSESFTAHKLDGLSDSYDVALVNVAKNGTVGSTIFSTSYLAFSESAILSGTIVDYSSSDFQTKWASKYTYAYHNWQTQENFTANFQTESFSDGKLLASFSGNANSNNMGSNRCFIPTDLPTVILEYFGTNGYQVSFDMYATAVDGEGNIHEDLYNIGEMIVPTLNNGTLEYTVSNTNVTTNAWTTFSVDIDAYLTVLNNFETQASQVDAPLEKANCQLIRRNLSYTGGKHATTFYFTELRLTKVA